MGKALKGAAVKAKIKDSTKKGAKKVMAKSPKEGKVVKAKLTLKPIKSAPVEDAPIVARHSALVAEKQRADIVKAGAKSAPDGAVVAKKPKKPRSNKARENTERLTQLGQKWTLLQRKAQEQDAKPYHMRQVYEAKTAILHKLLGWGYILSNKNDRLEVLFKDGIRFLISNYKS
jgi:hypothetical protein